MSGGSRAETRENGRRRDQRKPPLVLTEEQCSEILYATVWCGFWPALNTLNPRRWPLDAQDDISDELRQEQEEHLCSDILEATGYEFVQATFVGTPQKLFDAFEEQHFSSEGYGGPAFVFHGSSEESVEGILESGFDEKRCLRNLFGCGAYLSAQAFVALMYAQACQGGLLHVVFGSAHLGNVQNIPVGRPGQIDFGKHPDGTNVLTLRNNECSCFCVKCDNANNGQVKRQGKMSFRIDTSKPPSDFALRKMTYPPAVWAKFKQNVPGIVARRMRLQARAAPAGPRRKRLLASAWTSSVGRRAPLPRAAKAARAAALGP